MYVFDDEMIHDSEAMWDLALTMKVKYMTWTKELEKLKTSGSSIIYDGELIFKHHDEKRFKKAVEDYKNRVKVLENMIKSDLSYDTCKYSKYVSKS